MRNKDDKYLLSLQPFLNFRKTGEDSLQAQSLYKKYKREKYNYFLYHFDLYHNGTLSLYPIDQFEWYIEHNKKFPRPSSQEDFIVFHNQGQEFQAFIEDNRPFLIGFQSIYYERFLLMGYMYSLNTEGLVLLKKYLDEGIYGSAIFPYPFENKLAKPYHFPYISFIDLAQNMNRDVTLEELGLYLLKDVSKEDVPYQQLIKTMELYLKILELRNDYYKDRLLFKKELFNTFGKTNREIISELLMKRKIRDEHSLT